MLRFIMASHERMAQGLRHSLQFLTNTTEKLYDISAYTEGDSRQLEDVVRELFTSFHKDDTVIIMTDMLAGSVNQKFVPYLNDHVHAVTGINVPLALALIMTSEEDFSSDLIKGLIEEGRHSMLYVNDWLKEQETGEDDE
ncbi:MAG: PTS sorbitol transporter subunit IIB [Lachnospiraceae bacterium]|nr:PTS sorbitol transporter subunit IIB [Lachnospiraceae bacterium]